MIHEKIFLSEERNVYIKTYLIEDSAELHPGIKRPLVLICPGGGYSFLSEREAEPIALTYLQAGYHAAILYYGINEYAKMPGPLNDIADAVYYLKGCTEKWHIAADKIFVSGFSAGAHVATSLAVFWNNTELLPKYKDCFDMIRPAGAILGYSVIDLHSTSKHLDIGIKPGVTQSEVEFSQRHPNMPPEKYFILDEKENRLFIDFEVAMNAYIFGGEYTEEEEDFYSLQNQVTKDTVPCFIWHTAEDGLIYPSNSLLFATELAKNGIPYELHIFGKGDHGLALSNHVTANYPHEIVEAVQPWTKLAIDWLNRQTGFNNIL